MRPTAGSWACPCINGDLDRSKWSLIEVARMANYKSTIWTTWDPTAPGFGTFLGEAKAHLDYVLDARDGREGGSEEPCDTPRSAVTAIRHIMNSGRLAASSRNASPLPRFAQESSLQQPHPDLLAPV
jgi:hypothetical protein